MLSVPIALAAPAVWLVMTLSPFTALLGSVVETVVIVALVVGAKVP